MENDPNSCMPGRRNKSKVIETAKTGTIRRPLNTVIYLHTSPLAHSPSIQPPNFFTASLSANAYNKMTICDFKTSAVLVHKLKDRITQHPKYP